MFAEFVECELGEKKYLQTPISFRLLLWAQLHLMSSEKLNLLFCKNFHIAEHGNVSASSEYTEPVNIETTIPYMFLVTQN